MDIGNGNVKSKSEEREVRNKHKPNTISEYLIITNQRGLSH